MFANWTEETCTGTGNVLTLTGATSGNIQFNKTFAVGDKVAYALEDSGGSIKVLGIGTYSAADQITRTDVWNYNGTVIDKSPASNVTLGGGTHTIKSVPANEWQYATASGTAARYIFGHSSAHTVNYPGYSADTLYYIPFIHHAVKTYTTLGLSVFTAAASSNTRLGIYTELNGQPNQLIVDSGAISTALTGEQEATGLDFTLTPGVYFAAMVSDDGALGILSAQEDYFSQVIGAATGDDAVLGMYTNAFTYAALPQTAPTGSIGVNTTRALFVYGE